MVTSIVENTRTMLGRRAHDRIFAEILARSLETLQQGHIAALYKREVQAVEVPAAAPTTSRRPRRTKAQLKEALKKALSQVMEQHPTWKPRRAMRRARSLVRLYKIV